jgi:cytochrome c
MTATFDKAVGALLLALLLVLGLDRSVDHFVLPLPKPPVEQASAPADGGQPQARGAGPKQDENALPMIAAADPQIGARVARQCQACHTFEDGGANKVGPNLANIVGGQIAHRGDFAYSATMAGMKDQKWTYENLDAFLKQPRDFAKGTKMTFGGLRNAADRAAVIKYLMEHTANPPPPPS